MKPKSFEFLHDIRNYEKEISDAIFDRFDLECSTESMVSNFEYIFYKIFDSLYGHFANFDGLVLEKKSCTDEKITLEGAVYWLQDGLGNRFKIDVAKNTKELLYSYKLFDDLRTMNQTFYVSKNYEGWVVCT